MKFDKRISGLLAKSLLIPLGISCFNFCCVSAMESKSENINQKDLTGGLLELDSVIRGVIDCYACLGVKQCAPGQEDEHRLANLQDIFDYINSDKLSECVLCYRPMIKYYIEKARIKNKITDYYYAIALRFLNDDKQFPKFLKERANAYIREKI